MRLRAATETEKSQASAAWLGLTTPTTFLPQDATLANHGIPAEMALDYIHIDE